MTIVFSTFVNVQFIYLGIRKVCRLWINNYNLNRFLYAPALAQMILVQKVVMMYDRELKVDACHDLSTCFNIFMTFEEA